MILRQTIMAVSLLATGCALAPNGVQLGHTPPAVQGSNDVQGSPPSVPGAGMGVGSGNPGGASVSGSGWEARSRSSTTGTGSP